MASSSSKQLMDIANVRNFKIVKLVQKFKKTVVFV
jgi:hypothetical protein